MRPTSLLAACEGSPRRGAAVRHGLLFLSITLVAACGESGPPVPASVAVSPASISFASLADTVRLSATVRDENGEVIAEAAVTWASSDASIADIDTDGLVTSVADGSVTITATAGSASGSAGVTVEQRATTVNVSAPQDSLIVGDSIQMTAEALDAVGSTVGGAVFVWESSDTTIATVNDDGWVFARAPGAAEITASLGEIAASTSLTALPLPERRALQLLYEAAGGALWKDNTNWLTDAPLYEWFGVELNDDGQVIRLLLTGNGLIGTIPPEIASLSALEVLHIGLNDLAGPIPPEIGGLTNLLSLELTYNAHTGEIPPEIGNLTSLLWFGAFGNQLTGEIPPEIGNLGELEELDLCYNQLTGPIPPEIGNMRSLRRFSLCGIDASPQEGNQLTGPIPSEIGNLSQLTLLSLGANQLEGPVPPEIANLAQLDTLLLYSNQLTAIPPEISRLQNLEVLIAYGNRLTGPLPPELGSLSRLKKLNAGWGWRSGRNLIAGSIPPEIGNLARLEDLDLGGNQLTGPIPPEIGNLSALKDLELGSNRLSGSVPPEIGRLARLEALAVCKNELDGDLPAELGNLTRLTRLFLCTNNFSGPVPPELGNVRLLRRLNVAGNRLTSAMPPSLVSLSRLQEFFWLNNDGLCVPVEEEFDVWLDGIAVTGGDRCAAADAGLTAGGDRSAARAATHGAEVHGIRRNVTEVRPGAAPSQKRIRPPSASPTRPSGFDHSPSDGWKRVAASSSGMTCQSS